jgi:hypothetical protein
MDVGTIVNWGTIIIWLVTGGLFIAKTLRDQKLLPLSRFDTALAIVIFLGLIGSCAQYYLRYQMKTSILKVIPLNPLTASPFDIQKIAKLRDAIQVVANDTKQTEIHANVPSFVTQFATDATLFCRDYEQEKMMSLPILDDHFKKELTGLAHSICREKFIVVDQPQIPCNAFQFLSASYLSDVVAELESILVSVKPA